MHHFTLVRRVQTRYLSAVLSVMGCTAIACTTACTLAANPAPAARQASESAQPHPLTEPQTKSQIDPPPVAEELSWRDFEIAVGGTRQRRPVYRVNMGPLSRGMKHSTVLNVHNNTGTPQTIRAKAFGPNIVSVTYNGADATNAGFDVLSGADSPTQLAVRFVARDPKSDTGVVLLDDHEQFIAEALFEYREEPREVIGSNQIVALSGQRDNWGPAQYVCVGPPPAGYLKIAGSESYTLGGHRKVCKSWINCFDEQFRSERTCFGVSPQGEEDSNAQQRTTLTVSARYKLWGVLPTLK